VVQIIPAYAINPAHREKAGGSHDGKRYVIYDWKRESDRNHQNGLHGTNL
jgi:hypothetical protein